MLKDYLGGLDLLVRLLVQNIKNEVGITVGFGSFGKTVTINEIN
jgi:hypothetical protein